MTHTCQSGAACEFDAATFRLRSPLAMAENVIRRNALRALRAQRDEAEALRVADLMAPTTPRLLMLTDSAGEITVISRSAPEHRPF